MTYQPPYTITTKMLNCISENILIKSSVFHYEFEFIHPF